MANEISLTASLTGYKPSVMSSALSRAVTGFLASMAGNFTVQGTISVALTATAIPLGQVVAPHHALFHNLDATNWIALRNGSGGTDLAQLLAGEWAIIPLITNSVPYAIASVAPCLLEYLIFSL